VAKRPLLSVLLKVVHAVVVAKPLPLSVPFVHRTPPHVVPLRSSAQLQQLAATTVPVVLLKVTGRTAVSSVPKAAIRITALTAVTLTAVTLPVVDVDVVAVQETDTATAKTINQPVCSGTFLDRDFVVAASAPVIAANIAEKVVV